MINKQKLTIIFFIIIFCLSSYVSGIYSIPSIVFSLFFYSIMVYLLYTIYKKIFDKNYKVFSLNNYKIYLNEFLYKSSSLIILLILVLGLFSYYQNDLNPAKMPIYEITNGDKVVVFQAMSHIGTPDFYQKVKNNISNLKNKGFVLFFEGVRPGTKENMQAFDNALGVKFDKTIYPNMSKLYGLTYQDNKMFLGLVNDKDYNVDVSMDDIIKNYNNLKIKKGIQNRTYNTPVDVSESIVTELAKLSENELKILRYVNKSFINLIIKSESLQETIQNEFANKELFDVILNKRNQILAQEIINSKEKKIITTYGLLHFKGVFDLLKKNDIKWQIKKIDYLYPIK